MADIDSIRPDGIPPTQCLRSSMPKLLTIFIDRIISPENLLFFFDGADEDLSLNNNTITALHLFILGFDANAICSSYVGAAK